MDAFAFDVHLAFGGDDGFDIVRLTQRTHIHVVIHHQEPVLQIRPGEFVRLNFLDAGSIHADPEDRFHDESHTRLALAALSDHQEHLLGPGRREQAVPQVLLQRRDVLRHQELRKELQPYVRRACCRIVGDVQPVPAVFLFFAEMAVQIPGAVGHMNTVLMKRDLVGEGHHLDRLHKVLDLPGSPGLDPVADLHEDLAFQGGLVGDKALDGIQLAMDTSHGKCLQKRAAKHHFIDPAVFRDPRGCIRRQR